MTDHAKRLEDLRAHIEDLTLDGYIQPYEDEWQSHFVPEHANRLRWLTGFTGSAGVAVVLKDKAVMMSDSRYTIQLAQEIESELYDIADSATVSIGTWLGTHALKGAVIGYDPALLTVAQREKIEKELSAHDIKLHPLAKNPVDDIWVDGRTQDAKKPVRLFSEKFAGKNALEKIEDIQNSLKGHALDFYILSQPASLCWMLNIRGDDIAYLPVVQSYAILKCDDASLQWFVEGARVSGDISAHIGPDVTLCDPDTLDLHIKRMSGRVGVSKDAPDLFVRLIEQGGATPVFVDNPATDLMAVKTQEEQDAMRDAHVRDGVAVSRLLHWVSKQPVGSLHEADIAAQFEVLRGQSNSYHGPSFPHIIGYGSNGAIVHYTLDAGEKGAALDRAAMLLMDTGGQYEDGTTDITRTVFYGEGQPTAEMKKHFTLVLKGHIALAQARFPKGTTGAQVDTLARKALWAEGLNYGHGTGHGVGTAMDVHEPSANIHPRGQKAFEAGMIITNEPGYYLEGQYGIRIENVLIVRQRDTESGAEGMMEFETITLAPIDRTLIDTSMLETDEMAWLNAYHARVYETLHPHLEEDEKAWLKAQTAPL